MSRYQISRPARQDLIDIRNFIAKDNRAAARKVLTRIRAACRMLAKRPQVGHLRTDLASEPLRFWPVYSYLIIYRPGSRPIEVVRVLHGARDISAIM
jgi:plasmid stabilization system protein ParE